MWKLFRKIPAGKTYIALVTEDPNVVFDYYISENSNEPTDQELLTISEWFKHYNSTIEEYAQCRQWSRDFLETTGWASLSDSDKDAAIELDIADANDAVPYLMGKGYTLDQAKGKLLMSFANDHKKNVEACKLRMSEPHLYVIIGKYLDLSQAASFFSLTQNLSDAYERQAIKGTKDSSSGVGFFDFIESTAGTIYETAGLAAQGFILNDGSTDVTPLVAELMDWFRYGKKN